MQISYFLTNKKMQISQQYNVHNAQNTVNIVRPVKQKKKEYSKYILI